MMDIEIEELTVFSRGHINLGSIFGLAEDMSPGYDKLEPMVKLDVMHSKKK
jgi:hypothetical protein